MSECSEVQDSSVDQSCSAAARNDCSSMETKICIVGRQNIENEELMNSVKNLGLQILTSETGWDIFQDTTESVEMIFLCDPFEGEDFRNLDNKDQRIIGPPIAHECAKNDLPLPNNSRPLFCRTLENHVICLTAFRVKAQVARLVDLIHHMGGSVRKEMTGRVTHLVANGNQGNKYKTAVSLGIPIMADEWIFKCWERRHDLNIDGVREEMKKHTQRIFCGSCLTFYGFSEYEKIHMEETTEQQGGEFVSYEFKHGASHIVVADMVELPNELIELIHQIASGGKKKSDEATKYPKIVKQEWFWASIHMDACADESLYGFKDIIEETQGTPKRKRKHDDGISSNPCSPSSAPRNKKKSLDVLSPGSCTPGTNCSRISEGTPIDDGTPRGRMQVDKSSSKGSKGPTARQRVAMELLQTETNYVTILQTILQLFKEPLEQDPIIPAESAKSIFGSLPDILQLHTKIKAELEAIVTHWKEDQCIGSVIMAHADELTKVYPGFINFFEMSKETIARCDREVPRFHALLMKNLSKPECGRQTLQELLIRPVQRLPSIILLITDLIKRTDKSNPDHKALSEAVEVLKEAMLVINEHKRKTEGQVQMFEILRDVDGCPANILSSHRFYVTKIDTFEMSDILVGRGEAVTIFLFSDSLEVTKRRGLKQLPMKSPAAKTPQKAYKHVDFINLKNVKEIVDVQDNDSFQNIFGIRYLYEKRDVKDYVEKEAIFRLVGDDISKKDLIDKLLTNLTTVSCTVDKEQYLTMKSPSGMSLSKSNMSNGTLSRAVRVARRTTRKVSRALSMNKTPKRLANLRRAASTMTVSPLAPSSKHNQDFCASLPRGSSTPP